MGSNAEVVQKAYSAFAAGDIAGILDLVDDNVEWSAPATLPQGGTFTGTSGAGKFFEGIGSAWESLRVEVESVGGLGTNLVVGVVHGSGQLRGGEPAQYGAVHVFTLEQGKITRFREYVDLDEAL
jgi:ketosteroid isomerase-like protein